MYKQKKKKKRNYLLVDKCCVCLCFGFVAVHRALQGVDDMVVGVVLVVVQNTVISVVLLAAKTKSKLSALEAFFFF